MGVDILSINLDNPGVNYSPGQVVSGKLYVGVSGEERASEIFIRFFGTGHTHWAKTEWRYERDWSGDYHHFLVDIHYQAMEIYFDFAARVFGDGVNRNRIPTGESIFPFKFQVPVKPLPVTCNFPEGHVVYGLQARIRRPWYSDPDESDPCSEICPVPIFTLVDLNITPAAGNAMQVEDSRRLEGCCCPSGHCTIRTFTPKLGFCVGEVVPFVVEVNNLSKERLSNMSATLTQMWTMYGDNPESGRLSKVIPIELEKASNTCQGAGQKFTWNVEFTIAPTQAPTPNPMASTLFKMEYVINLNAVFQSCCNNSPVDIVHPVIVGNVPLPTSVVVTQQTPKYDEKGGLA